MKKLLGIGLLSLNLAAISQNRQIEFEHGDLASVYEKAKKENKLIFVDAYTSWCGPCKWLAKSVFTNDTVADFFNARFVNYKMDMEKGEGVDFARKHDIRCYPTLLFIDAQGNLVNRSAGAPPAKMLIEWAQTSLIHEKTFPAQKKKLEAEGLNENTIRSYVNLLAWNCLDAASVVKEYMAKVKDEDLTQRNNWLLTRDYISEPESREIKHVVANQAKYEALFGKDTVRGKLADAGSHYFDKYLSGQGYDKAEFERSKKQFLTQKWPDAERILYDTELNLLRNDMPKYYARAADGYLKHHYNNANDLNSMAWTFYENVVNKDQLKAAVAMARRACELSPEWAHMDTFAAVQYKIGNYKEAEQIAQKAIETGKKSGDDVKDTEELLKKIQAKAKG